MRAITVIPRHAGSARLDDVPEPEESAGTVLVDGLALGICGTDVEIVRGDYGWPPPGEERLVLGHESLGRVLEAPAGSGFDAGDLVVGIVRRPDAVPCATCAAGEWDFCAQRRVHRARDQAAARLRLGALARRAGVRDQARPGARGRRRPARADQRGGQGVGADRAHRRARDVRAAQRAGHRRRADRPAGGAARGPARPRGARARPGDRRAEARARARLGGTYHARTPRPTRAGSTSSSRRPAPRRWSRRRCAGRRATGSSA